MKSPAVMKILFPLLILLAFITACARQPAQVESNLFIKGAPDWVNKGSNILNKEDARLFYGVGSAAPMGDMALQKAVADDRARAEVARVLTSYLEVVSNDYLSAARSGDTAVNEESVSQQITSTTKINMTGARIIGSWRDLESNTIWSIAELDMKYVKSTMAGINEMNPGLKLYFETSADTIFDHVAKEKK